MWQEVWTSTSMAVCKQKAKTECQNHQINKIIDISDDTLLPLKRHRKMIPFPDDPGTWKKVYMEFNKLKSLLTKMDKNMESINIWIYTLCPINIGTALFVVTLSF